jgi:NADH-quinone oxidoreductase subunit C
VSPKEPGEFTEVTTGSEPDLTDRSPENTLPAEPEQLQPEVVGVQRGMFGVRDSGDTSGYGGLVRPIAMPGGTARPYGGWFDEVADALEVALGGAGVVHAIEKVVVHRNELTFFIRREELRAVVSLLRDDPRPGASCTRSTTCCR